MKKISEFFYKGLNHWLILWVIQPILVGINLVIVSGYSNERLQRSIREFPSFGNFLMDNPAKIIFGSVVIIYVYRGILKLLEYFLGYSKKSHIYAVTILESLESVVNKKYKRFVDTLNGYGDHSPQKKTIFQDITQPDIQIEALMDSLVNCLKSLNVENDDLALRITLFKVHQSKPNKVVYNFPYDAPLRTSIGEFCDTNSTVSKAIASKKITIVEDTIKELKKNEKERQYIRGKTPENETYSIACYPVVFAKDTSVIYVISVSSSFRNFFNNKNISLYELIFKRYANRLALEHCLKLLKER